MYRWMPRETPELRLVDALSKSSHFGLSREGMLELWRIVGREVRVVDFGGLGNAINFACASRTTVSLLVKMGGKAMVAHGGHIGKHLEVPAKFCSALGSCWEK